jgi:hypothetical protein
MWVWDQAKGALSRNNIVVAYGYSGLDAAKNNPLMQDAIGLGPIPRGNWKISDLYNSKTTGPYTLRLDPELGTDTCGRSAFRIHGDSILNPGSASHGCIILPRQTRQMIWNSGDHSLSVVE